MASQENNIRLKTENKLFLNDNVNKVADSSKRELTNDNKVDKVEVKKNKRNLRIDNFAENNITIRNIIDNTLLIQLSEINVKLLDFEQDFSESLYNVKGKILPKIDSVELTLLNQNVNISEFKKFGFGLYVFFLYIINLLVIFGLLFIFALHYMYCIFYKYYRDYEEEYSLFFDYNILSLVSGVQIKKFRKYYIQTFGKDAFLEKYKNFDVIYKEYIFGGIIVFVVAFIISFCFLLYLRRTYKLFRIENPEIKNYTLIISGKDVPYVQNIEIDNEENVAINEKKEATKNEILKKLELRNEDVDINYTFKLSEYYEKMEEYASLREDKYKIQYRIKKNKCCCYICCCFCGFCFCCCCKKQKLIFEEKNIDEKIAEIKNEMNEIKNKEIYNPLYIITFKNKEDYDKVYSSYPHSYIKKAIKNICKKNKNNYSFYVNKAPSPEDILWQNLEFDKEYKYFVSKLKNFGISLIYVAISFVIQLIGEVIDNFVISDKIIYLFMVNIIISYFLGLIDSFFFDQMSSILINNSNAWCYSDITFYSILFKSIFKFINQGIFPFFFFFFFKKEEDDFSALVSKMFVIIEMDGFGFPMIDWLFSVVLTKGRDMYESTQKIMSIENIEKEISEQMVNQEGLSRLELEKTQEKKEMDLESNYSETLAIYWITMFYLSIYPIGIIQSFLNLLFKFIIEKNFLLNVYKRPEYINPHFGFFCFNSFNIGFFLFLCGDIIFFRNEDNKSSFGVGYIIFMLLILILPFFLLAKLIMFWTNDCFLEKKESKNLNDIKQKMKSDYRLLNPCYQREKIEKIFLEFKRKQLLTDSQYEELSKKLNRLNDLDLFKMQQSLRTQKIMSFEERKFESENLYKNESISIKDDEKIKLYYFLMQLGLISYLEEGNIIKPKKKRFDFTEGINIRSISLKSLSMQENLSNSDSSYFTTFNDKNELIMAYVDNDRSVKIFDVFHKRVLNDVKDLKHTKKIVCVDYLSLKIDDIMLQYLVSISLDNTMIISDLSINEKDTSKIIENIGNTFNQNENEPNNKFSLSTVSHNKDMWIITSYYYDKCFKIYNYNGDCLHVVDNKEYIISLEGLFYTEENTYICVRTPTIINLFINEYFIQQMKDLKEDSYINFKIIRPFTLSAEKYFIIITMIKKDFTSYTVQIIDIYPIFPLFTRNYRIFIYTALGSSTNKEVHIPMNTETQNKISQIPPESICNFEVNLLATNEQRNAMKKFYETDDNDKFNIGNILLWEDSYLIIGTPFNYLDILDYKNQIKVGVINNTESIRSINNNVNNEEISDIITYNISERINDPEYGSCFIMRDNKGKIQYIRPAKTIDKLNYRIKKSDDYFNDLQDEEKLNHIRFSARFYLAYCLISYFIPLITSIAGHFKKVDKLNDTLYTFSIVLYLIYAFFGIWLKGCVYDIRDESHTQRNCTRITIIVCLCIKIIANSMLSYRFCLGNKTGIIFVLMLFFIYFIHLSLNYLIVFGQIKFLLRTYWLGFIFYQLSRFCILLFFIISIIFKLNHVETYIYAAILCIILIYMYMANYFNTLLKDITYNSYIQAIFNYPYEWMNLFCCWNKNPKDFIKEIDIKYCIYDSLFLYGLQIFLLFCIILVLTIIVRSVSLSAIIIEKCCLKKNASEENKLINCCKCECLKKI